MTELSENDHANLLRLGTGPQLCIPYGTIHGAFESIVDSHPDIVAAIHGERKMTYRQLDVAANRLSHYLINSGLRPRERVCLVVQRSLEMLIGIMGILKAGCQYVPIDGGVASDEALRHMFQDTEARFILCLPSYWNKVKTFAGWATVLELGLETGAFYPPTRPGIKVSSDDGVYAMYTSGSTGVPKGVDVTHRAMANGLLSGPGRLNMTVGSKVAQVLSISFAMGAWEMLGSLVNGATIYLRGSDWNAILRQVDTLICTPSILAKYPQTAFENIKTVAVAGEACTQALADEWACGRQFHNFLGATEVFLFSEHTHTPGIPLSIGRPLPNTNCYVLDDLGELVPTGHKGTLWVGGAGVAKGYINLPLTTQEKFKLNKFSDDGSFMYNFGNVVRWREDGTLESFGRLDDQVKIKGFRVELEGVTAVLEKFGLITKAASLVINEILHAFYTSSELFDESDLDVFVRKQLPYYSVPERWVRVKEIPLNSNGKVDRAQLKLLATQLGKTPIERTEKDEKNGSASSPCDSVMVEESIVQPTSRYGDSKKALQALNRESRETLDMLKDLNGSRTMHELPVVRGSPTLAWLRHRIFITYRYFLIITLCTNIGVACWILNHDIKRNAYPVRSSATATAANLCAAILIRSEAVINLLFTACSSIPTYFPLWFRRNVANVYHIGGIHVGCATSAIMWFIIFSVGGTLEYFKHESAQTFSICTMVLSYIILALLLVISFSSIPTLRTRYHDGWESVHRFGGWLVLILYWILVGTSARDLERASNLSHKEVYLRNPSLWLIAVATVAIVWPWLFLRRVAVRPEVLSAHAIRLHFDLAAYPGKGVRLAQHPLGDWHGFATFVGSDGKNAKSKRLGYSVVVSRAGDFTARLIETAPTHFWIRGMLTSGVLRIATLFKSVVIVTTGSGIGPCLSIFPYEHVAMRILWTAPNHEQTFGRHIVDEVYRRDPKALVYNTRELGKPDMSLLAYQLFKESSAEAVLVISNRGFTRQIVYDMEKRGIPAYGPIFDS